MAAKETMIKKLGSEEAYYEYFRTIGKMGGKAQVPKGFAKMPKAQVRKAAIKGGRGRKLARAPIVCLNGRV